MDDAGCSADKSSSGCLTLFEPAGNNHEGHDEYEEHEEPLKNVFFAVFEDLRDLVVQTIGLNTDLPTVDFPLTSNRQLPTYFQLSNFQLPFQLPTSYFLLEYRIPVYCISSHV